MRRQLARAFGLLLGYLACVLGLRLVDALEAQLTVPAEEPAGEPA